MHRNTGITKFKRLVHSGLPVFAKRHKKYIKKIGGGGGGCFFSLFFFFFFLSFFLFLLFLISHRLYQLNNNDNDGVFHKHAKTNYLRNTVSAYTDFFYYHRVTTLTHTHTHTHTHTRTHKRTHARTHAQTHARTHAHTHTHTHTHARACARARARTSNRNSELSWNFLHLFGIYYSLSPRTVRTACSRSQHFQTLFVCLFYIETKTRGCL